MIDYNIPCRVAFATFGKDWDDDRKRAYAQARREINMLQSEINTGNPSGCIGCNKLYPSLYKMSLSLGAAAIGSAARALRRQNVLADDSTIIARTLLCEACPEYNDKDNRCYVCGCNIAAKTKLAVSSCPGKPPRWGQHVNSSNTGIRKNQATT